MSASSIALVLVAAVFHALWNRRLHRVEDRPAAMTAAYALAGIAFLPVIVTQPPPVRLLPVLLVSGVAQAGYATALSAAYRRGELSLVYPLARGTAPLVISLGAVLALSEHPSIGSVVGPGLLLCGLAILAVSGRQQGETAAIALALATGLCIATYSLADTAGVRHATVLGWLGAEMLVAAAVLALVTRPSTARLRASARTGAAIALGSQTAYGLVLLAYRRSPAGRVATLREVSVLIGLWLSGEAPGRARWIGAALVVAGAVVAAG